MARNREFFSEVRLNGLTLAGLKQGGRHPGPLSPQGLPGIRPIQQGLLAPYDASYPLIEPRELLPSFEKNFAEYQHLPSFSMVAFNRPLSYQEEIFQFDLLHPLGEGEAAGRPGKPGQDHAPPGPGPAALFKQRFAARDLTDLAHYEEWWSFSSTWTGPR